MLKLRFRRVYPGFIPAERQLNGYHESQIKLHFSALPPDSPKANRAEVQREPRRYVVASQLCSRPGQARRKTCKSVCNVFKVALSN